MGGGEVPSLVSFVTVTLVASPLLTDDADPAIVESAATQRTPKGAGGRVEGGGSALGEGPTEHAATGAGWVKCCSERHTTRRAATQSGYNSTVREEGMRVQVVCVRRGVAGERGVPNACGKGKLTR